MSAFDDDFAAAGAPQLFEQLGRDVVYAAPQVDAVTLTGIVGVIGTRPDDGTDGLKRLLTRTVTISTAALGGIPDPVDTATVTIDGVEWTVEGIERQTATVARLSLTRTEPRERSRAGYRGG